MLQLQELSHSPTRKNLKQKKPPLMRIQSSSTWWFLKVNLLKLEFLIHGKSRKIKGCTAPLKNAPREDFLHRREEKCTALLVSINIYCSTQNKGTALRCLPTYFFAFTPRLIWYIRRQRLCCLFLFLLKIFLPFYEVCEVSALDPL